MKNINSRILLIALFLLSFLAYPQDSLATKSKCDSLKAAYETRLKDAKNIENEMKMIKPYRLPYDDYSYFRTKQIWDSLYVAYKKQWTEIKILTSKYLLCIGKDISSYEKTQNEIPPAPPPPCEPVDPLTDSWSYRTPTQPYLPDDEQNSFNNYINTNYPIQALKNSISGSVELSFLCNEEGSVKNILVLNENPDNFGFGELATEAIKKIRFRPAFQNDLPVKMRIKKKIIFKPPQPPPPAINEEVFGWDYNTVPKLLPDYQEKMKQYINLNYPQLAIKNNISAKVILAFICNTDGYPEDIKIVSEEPSNFGFGKIAVEALKIVKFYPAHYSERDVSVKMRLPINFIPPKKEQLIKCDSLKAAYEAKMNEWKWMRNKMGNKDILKFEYDSLLQIDLIRYNEIYKIKQEYCSCTGDSIDINREPPPPPPLINLFGNDNSDLKIHSILEYGPELTQDSKNTMIEFLDKAYSGKGDKISGEVTIKFVCTKEGAANSITILKEIPKDMGFGEAVIEAMKLAEFIPAKEKNGEAVNIRMALHFYFYNRENDRVEIK